MIALFQTIYFIFTQISTPVPIWQRKIRQITYKAVVAMEEVNLKTNSSCCCKVHDVS